MTTPSLVLASLAALFAGAAARAQITLSGSALSYSQNFTSLAAASPWVNNSTIPGWYAAAANLTSSTGGADQGGNLASFGLTASERALGVTDNTVPFGLRFVNNSGENLGRFTLSYAAEQWRRRAVTSDFTVAYQVFEAGQGSITAASGWTALPELAWTSTQTGSAGSVDGNAAGNRAVLNTSVSGLAFAQGQELWFRFQISTANGVGSGIGVDDLGFTAIAAPVPEPSAFAAFAGLVALGLSAARRRR